MVVTICPPAGTNANNKTVLAHIPDAINKVDSAPSSALFQSEIIDGLITHPITQEPQGKGNKKGTQTLSSPPQPPLWDFHIVHIQNLHGVSPTTRLN